MGIFNDPNYNARKYGTDDPGSPDDWAHAYYVRMDQEQAESVLDGIDMRDRRTAALSSLGMDLGMDSKTYLTQDAVKQYYRHRVKETHPDYGGDQREFEKVHAAYSFLMSLCV